MRYARQNITRLLSITLAVLLITACEKKEVSFLPPDLVFITESGYTFTDTTILLNDTVKIGIQASSQSNEPLTHLNISINSDSTFTSIDSGFYSKNISYTKTIVKGMSEEETWSFYVRDREGRKSNTLSILLKKDSSSVYGNISHLPEIAFSAQENNEYGRFLSINNGQVYHQADAFTIQSEINLLYYYDLIEEDENTIASPGANMDESFFPGPTGVNNWTTTNTTRFEFLDNINFSDFNQCTNDSLILHNTFEFASGNRKSKNLTAGNIFAFVTDSGIKGIFMINEVVGQETGTINISIKMQEL